MDDLLKHADIYTLIINTLTTSDISKILNSDSANIPIFFAWFVLLLDSNGLTCQRVEDRFTYSSHYGYT